MKPPCEVVQKEYLFNVRSRVAQLLSKGGASQNTIARRLHITQPAVSKYLRNTDAVTSNTATEALATELAHLILEEKTADDELVKRICEQCMLMRIGGEICEKHKEQIPLLREYNCQICTELFSGSDQFSVRGDILREMNKAINALQDSQNFAKLIPQVRTNLVFCNHDAKDTSDVLGVPGRITTVAGFARALIGPRFGASRHTAGLLLWAKARWKKVRACICVSGNNDILTSAEENGFHILKLRNPSTDVEEIIAGVKRMSDKVHKGPDIGIHVPGGIGIEPILYLFSDSVTELVEKTIVISSSL